MSVDATFVAKDDATFVGKSKKSIQNIDNVADKVRMHAGTTAGPRRPDCKESTDARRCYPARQTPPSPSGRGPGGSAARFPFPRLRAEPGTERSASRSEAAARRQRARSQREPTNWPVTAAVMVMSTAKVGMMRALRRDLMRGTLACTATNHSGENLRQCSRQTPSGAFTARLVAPTAANLRYIGFGRSALTCGIAGGGVASLKQRAAEDLRPCIAGAWL